jgi:hypothetical protein
LIAAHPLSESDSWQGPEGVPNRTAALGEDRVDEWASTVAALDTAVGVARMVISTDTLLSHAATRHRSIVARR